MCSPARCSLRATPDRPASSRTARSGTVVPPPIPGRTWAMARVLSRFPPLRSPLRSPSTHTGLAAGSWPFAVTWMSPPLGTTYTNTGGCVPPGHHHGSREWNAHNHSGPTSPPRLCWVCLPLLVWASSQSVVAGSQGLVQSVLDKLKPHAAGTYTASPNRARWWSTRSTHGRHARDWDVPEVLRSGNHTRVARWRRAQSLRRTVRGAVPICCRVRSPPRRSSSWVAPAGGRPPLASLVLAPAPVRSTSR